MGKRSYKAQSGTENSSWRDNRLGVAWRDRGRGLKLLARPKVILP